MTRLELLTIVVGRARAHGFEFKKWYVGRLGVPWISGEAALVLLDQQRRYYALLFSHEFACAFWKAGEEISFAVPSQSYTVAGKNGKAQTITRQAFTRRSARRDAWRYHLREMALAEEPLRYIRKYLNVEDEFTEDAANAVAEVVPMRVSPVKVTKKSREKPLAHPLPTGLPEFLKRPYP